MEKDHRLFSDRIVPLMVEMAELIGGDRRTKLWRVWMRIFKVSEKLDKENTRLQAENEELKQTLQSQKGRSVERPASDEDS